MTQPFKAAGTNWSPYDVPALWSMVEPEQEWANRDQVSAWRRMSEVLTAHQENLRRIQLEIMKRWPSEGSAAARAFLDRLNYLIDTVQEASAVARGNASALNLLTDALLEARSAIESVHRSWQAAAPQQRLVLNQQAGAIMARTDVLVVEHGNQFQAPPVLGDHPSGETWTPLPTPDGKPVAPQRVAIPPLEHLRSSGKGGTTPRSTASAAAGSEPVSRTPGPVLSGGRPLSVPVSPETMAPLMRPAIPADSSPIKTPAVQGVLGRRPFASSRDLPAPPRRTPDASTANDIDTPNQAVTPVRAGRKSASAEGRPTTGSDPEGGGLIGGGLGGVGQRPSSTRRRQYPADEDWELPIGVAPVIQPGPELDPRVAFDPGPNVMGGHR